MEVGEKFLEFLDANPQTSLCLFNRTIEEAKASLRVAA